MDTLYEFLFSATLALIITYVGIMVPIICSHKRASNESSNTATQR